MYDRSIKKLTAAALALVRFANALPARTFAGWPVRRTYKTAILQAGNLTFSVDQTRALMVTTGTAVKTYAAAHGITAFSAAVDCAPHAPTCTVYELRLQSSRPSTRSWLYLHGGGYTWPLGSDQLDFIVKAARASNVSSLFVLEYRLSPALQFPGQLVQAAAAVRHIVADKGVQPRSLVLIGDSAGGNLTLAVLAHAKQPAPGVPSLADVLTDDFAAAVPISAWVSTSYSAPAYKQFGSVVDHLSTPVMEGLTACWKPTPGSPYADQLHAPKGFWHKLPAKKILLTVGAWEVFFNDVVDMAELVTDATGNPAKLCVGENEIHVQGAFDAGVGLHPERGSTWQATVDFLRST